MYFSSTQVTILVQVTYYITTVLGDDDNVADVVRETHYYVSDDWSYDTLFMQHCLMLHWR